MTRTRVVQITALRLTPPPVGSQLYPVSRSTPTHLKEDLQLRLKRRAEGGGDNEAVISTGGYQTWVIAGGEAIHLHYESKRVIHRAVTPSPLLNV